MGVYRKNPTATLAGSCPIVASYGGRDRTQRHAAQRLDEVLDDLGVVHDVKEYPEAGHGFMNDHEGAGDRIPLVSLGDGPMGEERISTNRPPATPDAGSSRSSSSTSKPDVLEATIPRSNAPPSVSPGRLRVTAGPADAAAVIDRAPDRESEHAGVAEARGGLAAVRELLCGDEGASRVRSPTPPQ